jgi:hypothetical protein
MPSTQLVHALNAPLTCSQLSPEIPNRGVRIADVVADDLFDSVITPTASYQPIQSAGSVTVTNVATATFSAGQVVNLINTANTSILFTNGTSLKLPSATNLTLGQYDTLTLWFDGTRWIAVAIFFNAKSKHFIEEIFETVLQVVARH